MPSFSPATFRRIVQASAVYDVLATAPFATPWTFAWDWRQLSDLNARLGGAALAPLDIFPTLIAALLGSLVLVWSALRIARPQVRLGRYDGAARFLFSAWMAWALHATGEPLLWVFLVPEFAWGVAQWWPVEREDHAG
jgi:hypothetical protein